MGAEQKQPKPPKLPKSLRPQLPEAPSELIKQPAPGNESGKDPGQPNDHMYYESMEQHQKLCLEEAHKKGEQEREQARKQEP